MRDVATAVRAHNLEIMRTLELAELSGRLFRALRDRVQPPDGLRPRHQATTSAKPRSASLIERSSN